MLARSVLEATQSDDPEPRGALTLPGARGPISDRLLAALQHRPHRIAYPLAGLQAGPDPEDLHLALYCAHQLHYQGWSGVDDGWEWEPSLLQLRSRLEGIFEGQLRSSPAAPQPSMPAMSPKCCGT